MIARKFYVTLLEMLIAIAILALIGGLFAMNINYALINQRFHAEVGQVVDELRIAQDLMLVFGTDVHLIFTTDKEKGGIKYYLQLETKIPDQWEKVILRPRKNLKTILGVFFNDLNNPSPTTGQIDIRFLSGGSVMSKGEMRLATSDQDNPPEGVLQSYICFPGHPSPIISLDRKPDCKEASDSALDQKLTRDTVDRVPEKAKKIEKASDSKNDDDEDAENPNPPAPEPKPPGTPPPPPPPTIKDRHSTRTTTQLPPR